MIILSLIRESSGEDPNVTISYMIATSTRGSTFSRISDTGRDTN